MIKALARLLFAALLLASSGTALACICGPRESSDVDDLAARHAHVALVRVSNVQLIRESELQSARYRPMIGHGRPGTRLYADPYQAGGAVARYVLIERIKGLESRGLPRLEFMLATSCISGAAPGDFLLLFWDQPNSVLDVMDCESRIVNLGPWLADDRLMLADLRENVASGRPMHPCDLFAQRQYDDVECRSRREESRDIDRKLQEP